MLGENNHTLPTSKIDLSYHPFIKYDIFEVNVNLPPRGNPIGSKLTLTSNISYFMKSKLSVEFFLVYWFMGPNIS